MSSIEQYARAKLAQLDKKRLKRRLVTIRPGTAKVTAENGRELINFCSNDYLGLTRHPAVIEAARQATQAYGAGAGASRLVSGNHPPFTALENRLARLKETDACCVFGSGYLANIGVIPCFAGPGDLIILDELCHASMHAGAKLTGGTIEHFRHNDTDHLEALLRRRRGGHERCLVLSEGVFGMDGDRAPLPALAEVAQNHDAWLYCDDAHALGVTGDGRGSAFAFRPKPDIPLQMGTLSKAVGAYGGYVCSTAPVIELIKTRARSLIYSTALPAGAVAAALAALEIIDSDRTLGAQVIGKARRFTDRLGLPAPESAIVPIILGEPERALDASASLAERGFLVTAIRPPTVPAGTARLRVTFSLSHGDADIDCLAAACAELGLLDEAA